MSSRALKKLYGKSELETLSSQLGEADEDADEDDKASASLGKKKQKKKTKKTFNFADVGAILTPADASSDAADENRGSDSEAETKSSALVRTQVSGGARRKKKKKKKNKSKGDVEECDDNDDQEDIDKVIEEVCGTDATDAARHRDVARSMESFESLLAIERRHLDPDNEMKRIFGSKVVSAEKREQRRRGRRPAPSFVRLVAVQPTWPPVRGSGLSMESLSSTSSGVAHFALRHNASYRKVQNEFWDAVDSLRPEAVMELVRRHPYHVDSLLQLAEICRIQEDSAMAAELIQRCLYAVESAFHSSFSLTSSKSRLSYRLRENRGFFLALFHHVWYVSKKGCHRTALEFCKLLLSLDPAEDPLATLLMIDFFALRSRQHEFLLRFYDEMEPSRNLSQLPNFAFSTALARFRSATSTEDSDAADAALRRALLRYPTVLHRLLDKCSVNPDSRVEKHPHFSLGQEASLPAPFNLLVNLYATRCFHCWKDPEALEWLERNTRTVMDEIDAGEHAESVAEFRFKIATRYTKTPRNVQRHVVVADVKEALSCLTNSLQSESLTTTDPLPPLEGINAYERPPPQETRGSGSGLGEGGLVSMFLRSLMPGFDLLVQPAPAQDAAPDAPQNRRYVQGLPPEEYDAQVAAAIAEADELRDAVAEGGAVGDADFRGGTELRLGVNTLLDALRELLTNLQPGGASAGVGVDDDDWSDDPLEDRAARQRMSDDGDRNGIVDDDDDDDSSNEMEQVE